LSRRKRQKSSHVIPIAITFSIVRPGKSSTSVKPLGDGVTRESESTA
jgi:hypothetical protein